MTLIISEIARAGEYLFVAFIVFVIYDTSIKSSETNKKVILNGLFICMGIALMGCLALGSPTCLEYESDVRGNLCIEYADDGYDPTTEQFIANFAYFFTLLFVPVIFAVGQRKKLLF